MAVPTMIIRTSSSFCLLVGQTIKILPALGLWFTATLYKLQINLRFAFNHHFSHFFFKNKFHFDLKTVKLKSIIGVHVFFWYVLHKATLRDNVIPVALNFAVYFKKTQTFYLAFPILYLTKPQSL